ncbi:MAG: RtcB family protein [Bacteroidales bacterium]|nr:RtcB family protein [Bacteroidales bacterium]
MQVKIINNREVKIWTDYVEESAMRQIGNLTTLPFLFHHLAIMPDVHTGMGMPIGGVLACDGVTRLNAKGILHAIQCQDDMQEATGAYKDIEEVIANELDLIKVKTRLLPIAVVKG